MCQKAATQSQAALATTTAQVASLQHQLLLQQMKEERRQQFNAELTGVRCKFCHGDCSDQKTGGGDDQQTAGDCRAESDRGSGPE